MKMKKAAKVAAMKMLSKLDELPMDKVAGISVSLMMKPPRHMMEEHHEDGPRGEEEHDSGDKGKPAKDSRKGKEEAGEEYESDDEGSA
jgi:hypothetical protein